MGAIIEASHDENGIIWPAAVAPFDLGIANLKVGDQSCDDLCQGLYDQLINAGLDPLLDDRDERAGAKFADLELIGLPWIAAVGPRGAKAGLIELKNRKTGEKQELNLSAAVEFLKQSHSAALAL